MVDSSQERLQVEVEDVVKPVLGVQESIIRYEFQRQGAIHAHCIFNVAEWGGGGGGGGGNCISNWRKPPSVLLDTKFCPIETKLAVAAISLILT